MALARQGDAQQALSEYGKGRAIIVQLKQTKPPDIAALAHDLACFERGLRRATKSSAPFDPGASPGSGQCLRRSNRPEVARQGYSARDLQLT